MVTKMEDRIKSDLVATSKFILDNLRPCDPSSLPYTPELLNRIFFLFNQGALLQYQYGEIDRAEALCRGQIELFARLSSYSTNRALCLACMVTPYMNLARIYGQRGEVRKSLRIFEDIYRFGLLQQDLSILGHRILVTDGPAIFAASAPGYKRVMLSCRVIEAARVLQTVEDYPALLALAETNESLPEYQDVFFKQYLLEVRSRALLHMRQYEMAIEALEDCRRLMPNTTDRIVALLLLSQIYRGWGRDDLARETLNELEEHFAAVEKFGWQLPILRQIAYRLALERHAMGDNSTALGPAEKAFNWCIELTDQPGSIKSAILLLRICSDETRDGYSPAMRRQWYDQLQRLASTTFFRLERACAYWELGLSSDVVESDDDKARKSADEFLQNSYILYSSIPLIDSRQSCDAVKRSIGSWTEGFPAHSTLANEIVGVNSSSIDSVFDALMEYVPAPLVASQ